MARFVPIDESVFDKASVRAERASVPQAVSARFDRRTRRVVIRLDTGIELAFRPRDAYGLAEASDQDLLEMQIEGAGGTLHFPRLDADFSVARLLEGFLGPMEWARREARAAASRENGKLGGRPRKVKQAA